MGKRRRAREQALKILYAVDLSGADLDEYTAIFFSHLETLIEKDQKELSLAELDPDQKDFCLTLLKGTLGARKDIDELICRFAENWEIERMAYIDKNILRLAIYEMLFIGEIPPKVSINEAIDIAKKYGDKDSGKFVNGILDRVKKEKNL